jgi:hypothetical protein
MDLRRFLERREADQALEDYRKLFWPFGINSPMPRLLLTENQHCSLRLPGCQ